MNLPNKLTVSRLGCAALIVLLLTVSFPFAKSLALVIFIIAGITDYLDGRLARTKYGETEFGRFMDPLTDKVLVCAAFVSFVELGLVQAWIVILIITREFLVTGLRLLGSGNGLVISAGRWGKHKMVWQITAISILLLGLAVQHDLLANMEVDHLRNYDYVFGQIAYYVSLAVVLITVISGVTYFWGHRDILKLYTEE